jgi:hypothetical protein
MLWEVEMERTSAFTQVEAGLEGLLEELRRIEPIFHTKVFGLPAAERERMIAPGFWEVGASGRRYSREFILRLLAEDPPVDAEAAGWRCWDFGLRRLGPDVYLLTYTLDQAGRITRRATVWQNTAGDWRILYHQGTVVTGEDDTLPA